MPHFVTLYRYTQKGMSTIKDSPARVEAVKKLAESLGGKVHATYLTLGRCDGVVISEFPDNQSGAKFTLAIGQLGNVTTETLAAFTQDEFRKMAASLP